MKTDKTVALVFKGDPDCTVFELSMYIRSLHIEIANLNAKLRGEGGKRIMKTKASAKKKAVAKKAAAKAKPQLQSTKKSPKKVVLKKQY